MGRFDDAVAQIKRLGDILVPYNFPQNDPSLEDDLNAIKVRRMVVDGYGISLYYSKADHNDFVLETVQLYANNHPFLPFSLVVKVGRAFLGSDKLALIEFMRVDRKIYCWTVYRNYQGEAIDPPHEDLKHLNYEGFEYTYLNPAQVNFY
jgi:hypothetical protein